jgi:hypothetical protein
MKKWIFISQFMCIVAAQAQLKVLSSGNVGIFMMIIPKLL